MRRRANSVSSRLFSDARFTDDQADPGSARIARLLEQPLELPQLLLAADEAVEEVPHLGAGACGGVGDPNNKWLALALEPYRVTNVITTIPLAQAAMSRAYVTGSVGAAGLEDGASGEGALVVAVGALIEAAMTQVPGILTAAAAADEAFRPAMLEDRLPQASWVG